MGRLIPLMCLIAGFFITVLAIWQIVSLTLEQEQALREARLWLDSMKGNEEGDRPFLETAQVEMDAGGWGKELYRGQIIGVLHIPRLERELPIVEGVDEDELAKGVGHHSATALPDQGDQILLSGHRDTVFRRLGELEKGDRLVIEMPHGTFTYSIYHMEIVDREDRSVIRSTYPEEILTLSTCYPFHFVGSAPQRYIIYAKRL